MLLILSLNAARFSGTAAPTTENVDKTYLVSVVTTLTKAFDFSKDDSELNKTGSSISISESIASLKIICPILIDPVLSLASEHNYGNILSDLYSNAASTSPSALANVKVVKPKLDVSPVFLSLDATFLPSTFKAIEHFISSSASSVTPFKEPKIKATFSDPHATLCLVASMGLKSPDSSKSIQSVISAYVANVNKL